MITNYYLFWPLKVPPMCHDGRWLKLQMLTYGIGSLVVVCQYCQIESTISIRVTGATETNLSVKESAASVSQVVCMAVDYIAK